MTKVDELARKWIISCERNPKYPSGHYQLVEDSFKAGFQAAREQDAKEIAELKDRVMGEALHAQIDYLEEKLGVVKEILEKMECGCRFELCLRCDALAKMEGEE